MFEKRNGLYLKLRKAHMPKWLAYKIVVAAITK